MVKAKSKPANILVWIMLGLLFLGLANYGFDNFRLTVRAVGSVGDREIPAEDYFRALQQEIRALEAQRGSAVPLAEAQALGLDRRVQGQLATIAALDHEAARLGLSVGDAAVAREILTIPAFSGITGAFDRETYRFRLEQEGFTEAEFEERLREEIARGILQAAVAGGMAAPAAATDAVFGWLAERRSFDVITLGAADLADPLPEPDEATLRAHHEARIAAFTRPEARRISYALLTPDMLIDTVEVDPATVRALYDERIDDFVQPERRLVERLVMPDAATAQAAADRIAAGEDFADLVAERDLTLEDVDLGDVTRAQLGGAAAEAVFALTEPGVVGPVQTTLGPALFRMNGILAAQETPFEEVAADLRAELAADRARRAISDRREEFEDLLAGGAEVEELAAEAGMELGAIDWTAGLSEGVAGYAAFREAAAIVAQGDFPELVDLDDGGVVVLRLDAIVPPAPIPFEEVREDVAADWRATETAARLAAQAEALRDAGPLPRPPAAAEDDTGLALGAAVAEGPVADRIEGVVRTDFLPDLPRAVVDAVFALAPGARQVVTGEDGRVHIVELAEVLPPDLDNPEVAGLRDIIARQTDQAITQDLFAYYVIALEREAGVVFDQNALAAVHAQFTR